MKLRILLLALLCLWAAPAFSQGLLWEKRIGWRGPDELTDVMAADTGTYIACGRRYSFGHLYGAFDWEPNICLVKFDSRGDTLWAKGMDMDGISPRLCAGDGNTFYLAFTAAFFPNTDLLNVYHIDYDGNVLDRWTVPGSVGDPTCYRMTRAQDGTLLLVGSWTAPQSTGRDFDMFVLRLEPTQGFVWFFNRYTDHSYTLGGWIEETPNGTYLASGSAGSHIWAIELDSVGNEIRRQTFYETPTMAILDETSCVQQTPGGGYVVSGKPVSYTPDFYYQGYHSSFSGNSQLWGGERTLAETITPHVQQDGSILFYNYHGDNGYLSKITQDSSSVWDVQFRSQISTVDFPRLAAIAYVGDSTAIGVGRMHETGPGSPDDQFYFCRIQGVGLAYNPAQPVTAKKRETLPALIAYPNPSAGSLTVHTRSLLLLRLYSLLGKLLLEAEANVSGTTFLDIAALPPGLYMLRQGDKVIKVMRE